MNALTLGFLSMILMNFPSRVQGIICGTLEEPVHGHILPRKPVYRADYGATIHIVCDPGFYYNGTSQRKCELGPTWSGHPGKCIRIVCGKPPKPRNGHVLPSLFENGAGIDDKIHIVCEPGYVHNGITQRTCSSDGKWSGYTGTCRAGIGSQKQIDNSPQGSATDAGHEYKISTILIPILTVLILSAAIGAVLYRRRVKAKQSFRKHALEGGHRTERKMDKQIDLDTEFVVPRVILQHEAASEYLADADHPYPDRPRQKNISIDKLLEIKDNSSPLILIQGRPGVGKTTLVHKLSRLWAQKKWAGKRKVLLMYNMRLMSMKALWKVKLADFLQRFNMYEFTLAGRTTLKEGIKKDGENLLIIMDAIDEFPNMEQRLSETTTLQNSDEADVLEWCVNIWKRNVLRKSTVLLVSRHHNCLQTLEPARTIEVAGLTPDMVKLYVDRHVKADKKEVVGKILIGNPTFLSVCSTTFFCMKLCQVLAADDDGLDDYTELITFTRITNFLLKTYLRRDLCNEASEVDPLLSKDFGLHISFLSKLAYHGLVYNTHQAETTQRTFSEDDLNLAGITLDDLMTATEHGLIAVIEMSSMDEGQSRHVEFVNISIQELLAMVHLATQDVDTICEALKSMWNSGRYAMAQRFLFGLLYDPQCKWICDAATQSSTGHGSAKTKQILAKLESFFNFCMSPAELRFPAIQMAYESQDTEVATVVGQSLYDGRDDMAFDRRSFTAVEMNAVLYVLPKAEHIQTLKLESIAMDETSCDAIARHMKVDTILTTIEFSHTNLTKTSLDTLADSLETNTTLQNLRIWYAGIGDNEMESISKILLGSQSLETMALSYNNIGPTGVENLVPGLSNNKTLKMIDLSGNRIGDEGCEAIATILSNNKRLEEISISLNNIGPTGVEQVVSGLVKNNTLRKINLNWSGIDDSACSKISSLLRNNTSLEKMSFSNSEEDVTFIGIKNLMESLEFNTVLCSLCIDVPRIAESSNKDFMTLLESLFTKNSNLKIKFKTYTYITVPEDIVSRMKQSKYNRTRIKIE